MKTKVRRESVDYMYGDVEQARQRLQEVSDMREEWRVEREKNITLLQQPLHTLHLFGKSFLVLS